MFLKELEILGFKSFAKKTKFSFNSGVSAIVGPNGCGKSNIADAVRWVLGEQNIRSLRGKQLTDIIFSGNHDEKPLNIAEVSLVLDNSKRILPLNWEEVNVKRRIYRSGETENFINGVPCKLREIQELFMNTGLGRNAYSIIAQGEIDLVLSAKPSDRRYLFEEAACISKYKYEKQKTLKNIEEINNNLDKISNIISEIKNQLLISEEEAKQLKKYKIYQENIQDLELYLIYQKYNLFQINLSKIEKKIEYCKKSKENILNNIKIQESKINTLNEELTTLNQEQENIKYEHFELENKNKLIQNEINLLSQKKIDFDKRIMIFNKEIEDINQKISSINKNKKEIDSDILTINKKLSDFDVELNNLNKTYQEKSKFINSIYLTRNNFKNKLKSLYEKELFVREKEIKYKTTLNILNLNLNKISDKRNLIEEQLSVMKRKENDYHKDLKEVEKVVERDQLIKNETRIKEIEKMLDKLRLFLERDTQEIKIKEERKDIFSKSLNHFSKIDESKTEIFYRKYLQENPDNICQNIIKLIDYIPPKYEKMIEIALKGSLNSIVINDIYLALNVINSLPKKEISEIKLVPLDLINKMQISVEEKIKVQGENIYGFADELIVYDKAYFGLFKVLLGNILIVEDTATALDISLKHLGKYKIITLNGIVVDFDGTINIPLGSDNSQENIFYIEREIRKLTEEIKNLKIQVQKNKKIFEDYNNIYHSLIKENDKIKILLQENEKKFIEKTNNLNKIIISTNELKSILFNLSNEENNITKEREIISKKYSLFNRNCRSIFKYSENINGAVKIVDNITGKKGEFLNVLTSKINDYKNFVLVNREKLFNLKEKDKNIFSFLNDYILSQEKKKSAIEEYYKELEIITGKIDEFNEQLKQIKDKDYSSLKKKEDIKKIIQEKIVWLENAGNEKNRQQKLYEEIKDEQHKIDILEVQYKEKYESIRNEVLKNFKLPIEKLKLYRNKASSQKDANQTIEILRDNILKMGQINFDAEIRYQTQLKRYNTLLEKYNEISQAKKILEKIIFEIDQIAINRFQETFDKVGIHFNNIFKKIFSGGEAKLLLISEEDILLSGIDIIARPPGKKTQNIELLSSGERSIIAIALLLALWKVNPSPFCFFDEIDTALDEVNAEKIAILLKGKELNQSQLIIITHQKSTMEAADTLYGITMEESGISKLVSVKLQS